MRIAILALAVALAACANGPQGVTTAGALSAADAATALSVGQNLTLERTTYAAQQGADPLVRLAIRHEDGRIMRFNELNHTPYNVMAQAPGGPLAQIMGLFGEERPVLYGFAADARGGAPFICAPEGPLNIGVYEGADGAVQIVGLRQHFTFETLQDGSPAALPFSPDQVCARLSFRRG